MTYIDYFGLTAPPFDVNPDPRFIYPHSSYREALAMLRYGIESRKGFIFISGSAGCGKTTLLHMLIHSLAPTVRAALIAKRPANFLALLREISMAFQLPVGNDRRAMLGQLNHSLIQDLRRGRISCLLFDDAHELSDEMLEEIRLLSNLETDKVKLLQIVLLAQPELETRLERPGLWQLKQRVVLRHRLEPLGSREIGPYIASRLEVAGCRQHGVFGRDAIEAVAAYSNGIPRRINLVCTNALVMAAASRKQISLALIEEVAHKLGLRRVPRATTVGPLQSAAEAPGVGVVEESAEMASEAWQFHAAELNRRKAVGIGGSQRAPSSSWMGVGMLLALMTLVAVSLLFYSRDIGNSLWKVPARLTSEGLHAASDQSVQRANGERRAVFIAEAEQPSSTRSAADLPSVGAPSERSGVLPNTDKRNAKSAAPELAPAAPKKNAANDIRKRPSHLSKAGNSPPSVQVPKVEKRERRQVRERLFEVVASSFVRDRPQSDADIIATLQPGTRVRLVSQRGHYLEVSWLSHTVLRGFVHREDAFFEPVHVGSVSDRSRSAGNDRRP